MLADVKIEKNLRSGVKEEGGDLLISRDLSPDKVEAVIKREAFILFLPPSGFPHIYDLAWAYSNADPSWWLECTQKVELPTAPPYYAPKIFQVYSLRERISIIKSVTKAINLIYSKKGEKFGLDDYLLLLLISRSYPSLRLSKRELQVLKSLIHVTKTQDAKLENLAKYTGLSLASISRALRDLISKGIIHGPYAVSPLKMGLLTYIMELEDPLPEEVSFLKTFPFTYNVYVSEGNTYYVLFLVPLKYERAFVKLSGSGLRIGKLTLFSFDLHSLDEIRPEEVLGLMVDGYSGSPDTPPTWREVYRGKKPPIKLDKRDVLALSVINSKGKASRSYLRGIGVPNAAERFAKYRRNGLVVKGYFPTGVGLGEALLARFDAPYKDFLRIGEALSKISSPIMFYTEGPLAGVTSVILVNERILGTLIKSLRALFSDQLVKVEHLLVAGPSNWRIPVDLWNEEEQTFEMDVNSLFEAFSSRLEDEVKEQLLG
ncbi:MAG: hypothetical protein QI197_05445 [Candidatus Korarchaeota archaeon]|nr:hypothetical protein [Candidatus Korarchaeota archaeon]